MTPLEAWNSDYMRSVRTTMMEGNIPASCTKCFEEEAKGVASKRLWETSAWIARRDLDLTELLSNTTPEGRVPDKLQYLDLRLGHTCNIKCVMCSPHDSSKWVKDWQELFPQLESETVKDQLQWDKMTFNNKWHENPEFWDQMYRQIPYLKEVYFAGGEPLMIKQHKEFIEQIVKSGYAKNIILRYNTNGLLIDKDLMELWNYFQQVKVGVSIDATGQRNAYIRHPSDWNTIEETMHMLDNSPYNISPSIATAIQIFNVKHLPDFAYWKMSQNFKKVNTEMTSFVLHGGGLFNMHLLYIPTFLSIQMLPKDDKKEVEENFMSFKGYLKAHHESEGFWDNNPYGWARWEGVLNHMNAQDNSYLLPDFKEHVTKLDAIRGVSAKKVFPELAHLL